MRNQLHYTPESLSENLIAISNRNFQKSIADFCVGDGSLIKAAFKRWPNASLFINDLDQEALKNARNGFPHADYTSADFLSPNFSELLPQNGFEKFSLVVLNPPFSHESTRRWRPRDRFSYISCSQAMAFLLTAICHVDNDGEILAILPASTTHSDIDHDARTVINTVSDFQILSEPRYNLFPGISATTYIARLSNIDVNKKIKLTERFFFTTKETKVLNAVIRGNISIRRDMRKVTDNPDGIIHTTSIRNGLIVELYEAPYPLVNKINYSRKTYSVILPRVGRLTAGSIAIAGHTSNPMISDCLFAIRCSDEPTAEKLRSALISNFEKLKALYSGTGASYITRFQLVHFLLEVLPQNMLTQFQEIDSSQKMSRAPIAAE